MAQVLTPPTILDQRMLLAPLQELVAQRGALVSETAGRFEIDGAVYEIPRFRLSGAPAGQSQIRLGVFAGLHGDEPAGGLAAVGFLTRLFAQPELARGYEITVYPVTNPTGWEDNTRHNRAGLDLNREFWTGSQQPEVRILETELQAGRFDGIIALHADDTSSGLYGYAHDSLLNEALLRPALAASERVLPRDRRDLIDGFAARDGVIRDCFHGVLSAPRAQRPQPFDIIFETPAFQPLGLQSLAAEIALLTILDEYRGFIAQAQYL